MEIEVREPHGEREMQAYYRIRWEILRKPWYQPIGSEKDELENKAIHAIAVLNSEIIGGVARLHFNSPDIAQIRYMGVIKTHSRKGIGSELLAFLEKRAMENKVKTITLNARENALAFYENNGYKNEGKGHLLWNAIQHYKMKKYLS